MTTCPECATEFEQGPCPQCARGPEGGDGPEGHWEQAAETGQLYEAELIALRLRSGGIEAQVVDQTIHVGPLPDNRDVSVVHVMVPADRLEAARALLATSAELPADVDVTGTEDEISEDKDNS
jgi:hypothetical protein